MKLRTIAFNTFGLFLRDRLLIIFAALFLCVILLMMPHSLRVFFFFAALIALPRGQFNGSVSVSVVSGRAPRDWLILKMPPKKSATPPPAAISVTVPWVASTVVPTGS
jgi:hypothetical protein